MSESPVEALKELVTAEEGKLLTWVGKAGGTEAQKGVGGSGEVCGGKTPRPGSTEKHQGNGLPFTLGAGL